MAGRNLHRVALAMGVALALPGAASAAQLLTNNSFESPDIGAGHYTYPGLSYGNIAPIGATQGGWTFSGSALVNASGGNAWYAGSAPSGMDGVQFAALQGTSTLSQAFTANASTLHLGWLDTGRAIGGMGDQTYDVLLNGVSKGQFSTANDGAFGFNSLDLTGLMAGSSYSLAFQGLATTDQTAFIDGVQLSDAALMAPAGPPSKIVTQGDLPIPTGFSLIDDFDHDVAPGFTFTGGFVRLGALGLLAGVSAPPPGDLSLYETVMGGQQATLTSSRLLSDFSFYMGSPDSYNSVRFRGPSYDFTLSGGALWSPEAGGGTGDQGWGRRVNYNFGGYGVNQIVFSSGGNSFEFDNLAGKLQAGVPEPSTWTMMILGVFGAGALLRRRRWVLVRA